MATAIKATFAGSI